MKVIIASLNTAIERLLLVDKQRPGEVHRLLDDKTLAGGKGVNVARVLQQLRQHLPDAPAPLLLGFLGGATGRLCGDLLRQEALEGCWCDIAGSTRICEVITEVDSPENASVYNAGGPPIRPEEHQRLHTLLQQEIAHADALICTGSLAKNLPPDEYGRWITLARARGVLSLLDTHGAALLHAASAHPDIIKINRDELRQANATAQQDLPAVWLAQGVRCVIITDGPRPTQALTPDGNFELTAPSVITASPVGSGDAYCAGLIASLLSRPQAGWVEHLKLAAACGAANAASSTAGLATNINLATLQNRCAVRAISIPPRSPA
ncbi:tagatose 6-phosphate kinase [Raoultella sp. BIGb0138]|uniref:1-phosphofructokinase family hexose kinase n=1 Tax=Raoultella sp. BIGb0138 TaxID=2485115 RepID=UPI00104746D5|nr:PfkB family carbohydrate kinase [Raoultella sp. BIGb0138]TCW09366.1 tagatose 6-phosphate kinase [Raoultella sp. BIGb0138]